MLLTRAVLCSPFLFAVPFGRTAHGWRVLDVTPRQIVVHAVSHMSYGEQVMLKTIDDYVFKYVLAPLLEKKPISTG